MMCRAVLAAFALLAGCSSDPAGETVVHVDLLAPSDTSCIGVSGFQVEVTTGGADAGLVKEMKKRSRPVLSNTDCKLESAVSLASVDLDAPLDISVKGFDGAGNVRVAGTVRINKLRDAPDQVILLKYAGAELTAPPVLAIERVTTLLAGKPVTDLMSIEVTRQPAGTVLLKGDNTSQFFDVGEPWAAQVQSGQQLTADEEITVRGVLTKSNAMVKLKASQREGYFEAVPIQ
jgi:hypothetical protein